MIVHGGGPWRMMHGRRDEAEDFKLSKGLIKRVMIFARPYWLQIGLLVLILFLSSFLTVIGPRLIARIIDVALPNKDLAQLNRLAGLIILLAIGGGVAGITGRWVASRIGEGVIFNLRVALFEHIQRMPIAFFTRTQTGSLISRLNNDVIGAQRAITETTAGLLQTALDLGLTLLAMWTLAPRLTLISLIVLPLFVLPTRLLGGRLQRYVRKQMDYNAAMNTQMAERFQIGGAMLVKLFGSRRRESDQFSLHAGNVRDLGIKTALLGRVFFVTFGLVAAVGMGLSYWYGGREAILGRIGVGVIVAISLYLQRLYMPIAGLSQIPIDVKTAFVSFDRVFEVLDFPNAISDRPGAFDLESPKGRVEFDHVRFRYPPASAVSIPSLQPAGVERPTEGTWALRDVSFEIPAGKMAALVGPSGAGKTTISMLIPRLYDVTEGTVRLDGHDIRDLTLESVQRAVGVVTQDPHMFHDSIKANLMYAKPDATEEEMVAAAKAAQIHELIASLPDGYDTIVGERGYRLSGGEKQRLAIARLLLKDPAIMILDEATAHLDSESELLIQRALAEALAGRSSVVIAHRLSTVVRADQILVVDRGEIVERGTHFELLDKGGLYSELYRTQFERAEARVTQVERAGAAPVPTIELRREPS